MKKPFYEKLDDIPQTDRDENNYELNQRAGSPHFGKYVLIIDSAHPVMAKNTELIQEQQTRETAKTTAVNAAVAPLNQQIQSLTTQLQTAQAQSVIPAGQIAVPADTLTVLNNYKTLGEFDAVKAKVDEHGTLKEKDEANTRKNLFAEVARDNGLDEEAFASLAEPEKLNEKLESREIDDGKGNKVKHWFVKGKDAANADTSQAVADFVKTDPKFKPFTGSLFLSEAQKKNKVAIPNQKHGEPPAAKSGASTYLNKTYKREEKKAE